MLYNNLTQCFFKASYQRQYKNEILSKKAVQLLEGAAGSFGDKKGE